MPSDPKDEVERGSPVIDGEPVGTEAQRATPGACSRLWSAMFAPVDIAPLVYFRIIFGAIMLWEVVRYFQHGRIERYYINPIFFFKYYGFDWVQPWPGTGMFLHFLVLGALSVCIMLGLYYRTASVLFFLGFTYVFLLDQANYLNHFYLISLVSFLLIFLPANRTAALDVVRKPGLRSNTMPTWALWLLRFQIGVPYFYGGLAKLNVDWLRGQPMRMWLADRADTPVIGTLFNESWTVYAFSYGGLMFDLLIVPMLLWRKTRWLGIAWLLAFHLLNATLFNIGIFPWFMLLATPLFLPADWIRRTLRYLGVVRNLPELSIPASRFQAVRRGSIACAIGVFVLVQVLVPFRHLFYPGRPSWTEEGHRFSWHMKLRDKEAQARFIVSSGSAGATWTVDPAIYLTRRQTEKMGRRPDMILQFSHFLAEQWRSFGHRDVEVKADVTVSLNGRQPQRLVNPDVDLACQPRTLLHCDWILPLAEPLPEISGPWYVAQVQDH